MRDTSNREIVPVRGELALHTNQHPNTDGTSWGWIDGCANNVCWSDNCEWFNLRIAEQFVHDYNADPPMYRVREPEGKE